jgi:hypothetical protein
LRHQFLGLLRIPHDREQRATQRLKLFTIPWKTVHVAVILTQLPAACARAADTCE